MRKHSMRLTAALVGGLALVGAACGSDNKGGGASNTTAGGAGTTAAGGSATTAGGGGGGSAVAMPKNTKCAGYSLGFFGALTGDAANLGINIQRSVQLAVEQWNKNNPDCKITETDYDSQGDPKQAPALADKAIGDAKVLGIVGPAFSGESRAANPKFNEAGLPIITPSATGVDLSTKGWTVFHRALANDGKQGPGIAKYISSTLGAKKVVVIDDASEYGKGLA